MRSFFGTAGGLLLCLISTPAMSQDAKPVRAAMTIYGHIARTEAMISVCRRIDVTEADSYNEIYQKYENEIAATVIRIGLLVGQYARGAGVDKNTLLRAIDDRIDSSVQQVEWLSRWSPDKFTTQCRALPKAMYARTGPFEPLAKRFPSAVKTIENER